jgi:hypothetical protein
MLNLRLNDYRQVYFDKEDRKRIPEAVIEEIRYAGSMLMGDREGGRGAEATGWPHVQVDGAFASHTSEEPGMFLTRQCCV